MARFLVAVGLAAAVSAGVVSAPRAEEGNRSGWILILRCSGALWGRGKCDGVPLDRIFATQQECLAAIPTLTGRGMVACVEAKVGPEWGK